MVGDWRRISLPVRRMPLVLAGLAVAPLVASPAYALSLTPHTNRGGKCRIRTTASRSGAQISYGVKVNDCSTKFGIRYVVSLGALYDQTAGVPVKTGYLARKKSDVPYSNHRSVSRTDTTHAYQTRIDLTIVLKAQRNRRTRHPERWLDPGTRCRVKTTTHNADTLGCELNDTLPAG